MEKASGKVARRSPGRLIRPDSTTKRYPLPSRSPGTNPSNPCQSAFTVYSYTPVSSSVHCSRPAKGEPSHRLKRRRRALMPKSHRSR